MAFLEPFRTIKNRFIDWKRFKKQTKSLKKKHSFVAPGSSVNGTVISEYVYLNKGNYDGAIVGKGTYTGGGNVFCACKIGKFCSISPGVHAITAAHPVSFVSTYPGLYNARDRFLKKYNNSLRYERVPFTSSGYLVDIGNDVWLGENVTLMPGISVGDGAVVGAGAVVTKNVPAYAIVAGVPARIIRFRFSPEDIEFLLQVQWWEWPDSKIEQFAEFFDSPQHLQSALDELHDEKR